EALERTPDAQPGPVLRRQPRHVLAEERDSTALVLHKARQGVERGGLPGAVGTDEPGQSTARGLEADVAHGEQAAVADAQSLGDEAVTRLGAHDAPAVVTRD